MALWRLGLDVLGPDPVRGSDAIKSLLPIAAAAVGLPLIIWRLAILNRQTATAEAKTQIDRETHYTSIFSRGVDQLGQTRDQKDIVETEQGKTSVTRTAPNIEVRLGGIHSLTRLAEESQRDAIKIERMLISYIRENSWTDRNGQAIKWPETIAFDVDWRRNFRGKGPFEEARTIYDRWQARVESAAIEVGKWRSSTPDARVDTSEALEAIEYIIGNATTPRGTTFSETLFANRRLSADILRDAQFNRCVFVGSSLNFSDSSSTIFTECRFISCHLDMNGAKASFEFGQILTTTIYGVDSELHVSYSHIFELDIHHSEGLLINLRRSTWHNGAGFVSDTFALKAIGSNFSGIDFTGIRFPGGTSFNACVLVDVDFQISDLSAVEIIGTSLEHVVADESTLHPGSIKRPSSWPEYHANANTDEP